jgi:hypothetical protein
MTLEDEYEDGQPFDFGVRKKNLDKVTYRDILKNAIQSCLWTKGTFMFKNKVMAFESSIYIDVTGYRLKPKIEEIRENLQKELRERERREKKRQGKYFYSNANQAMFTIRQNQWYWDKFFEQIYQLVAEKGLLIDKETVIPLRIKKPMTDEGYVEPEEPIEDLYR